MPAFEKIALHTHLMRTDDRTCSSIYMIEENGKKLLIDSGDGKAPIDFTPDICILTHGHYDHTLGVKDDWKIVLLHPRRIQVWRPLHQGAEKRAAKSDDAACLRLAFA